MKKSVKIRNFILKRKAAKAFHSSFGIDYIGTKKSDIRRAAAEKQRLDEIARLGYSAARAAGYLVKKPAKDEIIDPRD